VNFDFTEDQQTIKRTAHELLAARLKPDRLRELAEGGVDDTDTAAELLELGWPGIAIAEEHGGQGLGLIELVILQEELGYALAPVPFLSNVSAAMLLERAGSDAQRERWLSPLLSGGARGTLGLSRDGHAPLVPDASGADVIVLVDEADGSGSVHEAGDVQVSPHETIDMTRRFGSVTASGAGDPLDGDVADGLARVTVALAAESVGIAQRVMEDAVAYAKDRKQFGQPIGVHQAVSHRCAQMLLETESARSATYFAAWAADHEPESFPLAAASAKAYASDAGARVTASAVQVLGGIGFTWEHDLHFFLKRAWVNARLYGTAAEQRERVAAAITA
jgi:alkylation response protein AidB-like acyl-CoA dehydrogenase